MSLKHLMSILSILVYCCLLHMKYPWCLNGHNWKSSCRFHEAFSSLSYRSMQWDNQYSLVSPPFPCEYAMLTIVLNRDTTMKTLFGVAHLHTFHLYSIQRLFKAARWTRQFSSTKTISKHHIPHHIDHWLLRQLKTVKWNPLVLHAMDSMVSLWYTTAT